MLRFRLFSGIILLGCVLFAVSTGMDATSRTEKIDKSHLEQAHANFAEGRDDALFSWQQQELKRALQAYFDKAIKKGDIVGAGVSIVHGDAVLVSEGYGRRSSRAADRVDGRTVFRLGSLSKGFTGVLAAKLVQDNKLKWDDRVNAYFPDFRLGGPENTRLITLSHILSHSSGAPYHSFTNLIEAGWKLTEVAGHFREVVPVGMPGQVYSYQNAIFALAGDMMQVATGQEMGRLLEETFFKPLEMCATSTNHNALTASLNVALPHVRRYRGWRAGKLEDSYYNAVGAGGINASALDMAQWMQMLLGHRPEIMDRTALAYAFTPMIEIPGRYKYYQRWPGHLSSYYGFGWRIHKFMEENSEGVKTMYHHGGSVNNFRNEIALYPEADLGICVLFNSNTHLSSRVIPDLYEITKAVLQQPASQLAQTRQGMKPGV